MRKLLIVGAVVATLFAFAPGQAADCGDGGSPSNYAGSCETADNNVKCGGTATPAGAVTAGDQGIEVCNDGSAATPVQGRVGAGRECQCIYADGDANNPGDAQGWIRLDMDGAHCSTAGQQSYNSGDGGACP